MRRSSQVARSTDSVKDNYKRVNRHLPIMYCGKKIWVEGMSYHIYKKNTETNLPNKLNYTYLALLCLARWLAVGFINVEVFSLDDLDKDFIFKCSISGAISVSYSLPAGNWQVTEWYVIKNSETLWEEVKYRAPWTVFYTEYLHWSRTN